MSTSRQQMKDLTPFHGRIKINAENAITNTLYHDCIQENPVSDLIKHIYFQLTME